MTSDIYYQVLATHINATEEMPYPMVMGYYQASGPDEAFVQFLKEHAPNAKQAKNFYDDITVVPVPKNGFKYTLSNVYTKVVPFPNHKNIENEGKE